MDKQGTWRTTRSRATIFTLVELLVVVAVIAILAGLLLPALNKAKESAKQIFCGNNLRQIGAAFQYYCDDNQGYLPITYVLPTEVYHNWTYYFAEYFGLTVEKSAPPKYYLCPSIPLDPAFTTISKISPNSYLASSPAAYKANQENGYDSNIAFWYRARKLHLLPRPSEYVPFAEPSVNGMFYFQWVNDAINRYLGINNHQGKSNYLHADGHVASMVIREGERGSSNYKWNFYPKGVFETGPIN